MDDKLAPLFQKQATLEKLLLEDKFSGPKMTDIVGGIGWIPGIAASFELQTKARSDAALAIHDGGPERRFDGLRRS